jgi:hypothetical protein
MAGNFFPVDREVLGRLFTHFRSDQWAKPIIAYLVLCKHQQRGQPFTTAGSLAIGKVLAISRYCADKLIRELEEVRWGDAPHEQAIVKPHVLQDHLEIPIPNSVSLYPVKGLPRIGSECLYLPNSLFEKKNGKPAPIQQLNKIPSRVAQYDALNLLLHCYAFHDVEGSGGLDPRSTFYAPWCYEGSCLEADMEKLGYQGVQKDRGNNWHFWLVTNPEEMFAQKPFIETVTEGDQERFSQAVANLRKQKFLLTVAMVFDRDPIKKPSAEPLYPLRVFDILYRQNAQEADTGIGGLYSETYNCLDRSGLLDLDFRYQTFGPFGTNGEPPGFYVVAATMKSAKVLGIFRLRYWPHDRDTGIGFHAEEERAAAWKEELGQAFR